VTLPWQPILPTKSRPNPHNNGSRDIRQGGARQEVQLLRRVQANKLPDSMDAGEINNNYHAAGGLQSGCALHLV